MNSHEELRREVHILLIEDDEDDYVIVRDLLDEFHWASPKLDWTSNYADALDKLCDDKHDIYLLDFRLGAENGIDLLRDAITQGCRGPIIMLTGQGDRETDLAAMESGAVDYMAKSTLTGPLLERGIRYAIHRKRVERELAEMQRRLADSQENERLRLAQELHDQPLQELLGTRLHLGAIRAALREPEMREKIDFILDSLQGVIDTLRVMCGELRPPALAPFGLDKAIRSHAQQFQRMHSNISISLRLDEDTQNIDEQVGLALFRIYQNAISNIEKHAEATRVVIEFTVSPDQIRLSVQDNGRGFRLPSSWMDFARNGHYGLLGVAERADAINGQLLVHSEPGKGSTVTVTVPNRRHIPEMADPQIHPQDQRSGDVSLI